MGKNNSNKEEMNIPELYEVREAKFRGIYRVFASTIMACISLIWYYRLTNHKSDGNIVISIGWIGMFIAELWFGLYWIITQSVRWSILRFYPFKERLSQRYETKLPSMDIFVCTADPKMEPPKLVINTVLSTMCYNYPSEKLSIYVSDDGCYDLTFYALIEASNFAKHWIPFCKRFDVVPSAPEAYFTQNSSTKECHQNHDWLATKKLYEEMKRRIDMAIETGAVSEEIKKQHKGFMEWDSNVKKNDHQSIVQILIDGRDTKYVDNDGIRLPTLVYLAREKRPKSPHHFKAGAMNALIRVSSEISNAPFILNLDCDMYSNNVDTIREVLCFFVDENKGHEFAFVQFPQEYDNLSKNDIYANVSKAANVIELAAIGGFGAALYCGTCCFHRREGLMGKTFSKDDKAKWDIEHNRENSNEGKSVTDLEESSKALATCSYENNTQWGKQMGLMYGCPVEDLITGLTIQCRGWKSVYYNPEKAAFLGVAPTSLEVALIQHKRWSEGMSQIFMSKYCPFTYAHGKISLSAQMGYSIYFLWAPFSLPFLYYVFVPSLFLLNGVPLFPQVSSLWFIPFAYVFIGRNVFSAIESMSCGSSLKSWWNLQRMWLIRRTTAYFFAFLDNIKGMLGLSETNFVITNKVMSEDAKKRYEQEIMEFGSSNTMFTIMSTIGLFNLFALVGGVKKVFVDGCGDFEIFEKFLTQILLCGVVVLINFPIYEALFIRGDKGRIPISVLFKSFVLSSIIYLWPIF